MPSRDDPSDGNDANSSNKYTTSSEGPFSHKQEESSENTFECEYCNATFEDERTLISHTTGCSERPSDARYECHYCGNQYVSEHALLRHRDQCNAKQAAAQPDGSSSPTYECDACGRTFSSRREMKIHEHDCTGTTASSQTGDSPGTSLPDRGAKGTVTSYDPADGYGFIEMADRSDDVFFHVSDYDGHDPSEGDYLQFDLEHRDEGAKAVNLTDADADSVDQWDQKFASERPRWGKDQLE